MGDKIVSVYWFAILFIVAGAVVFMVYSFYGEPYDVRNAEAQKLTDRTVECFLNGVRLDEFFRDEGFSDNFLENCDLNFETEEIYGWEKSGQYFVSVEISDFVSGEEIFSHEEGNSDLAESCALNGRGFPVCFSRGVYVLDSEGNQYKLSILSVVRKTEKNVN
ncbi:MAG: hypothetical protein KKC19_01505 [Nanoarchaeota archaeon]|nr:hypothetical protein [Nanoarchaeota archaeon]